MTTTTSLPLARATAGNRCSRVAALVVVLLALGWWSAGIAEGAPSSFDMSPVSGPPGTTVSVSGKGCTPLPVSSPSNVVAVTAPALGVTLQAPVKPNGSWHGTFVVPAGSNPGPTPVAAACAPLTALYSQQMFTVTAASTTTTRPTTTTTPSSGTTPSTSPGTTAPKPGGGGPTPTTGVGSNPSTTTVPTAEGVPPGESNGGAHGGGAGAGASAPGTRPGTTDAGRATRRAAAARAADLRAPELAIAKLRGSSTLGWLVWTLLLALVIGAVATPLWLRRSRRRDADPAAIGDVV